MWFLEHDSEFTVPSTDLSPTEHLWDVAEQETDIVKVQPTNPPHLCDDIMSIFAKNPFRNVFQRLVESVPQRTQAVLNAKESPVVARCT